MTPAREPLGDLAVVAPVDEPVELTAEWMTSALRAAGFDTRITDFEVEPVGTGQMSVSLRVRYRPAEPVPGLPESMVVKIASPDREVRPLVRGGYQAELAFYREVAPTVAIDAPRCHLAVANPDATSFTLLLEDLAPAEQGDQIAGAPAAMIAVAARNLAGLHGPRWCDPSLKDYPWLRPNDLDAHRFTADLVAGSLDQLAEGLGPALTEEDRETLERSAAVLAPFLGARPARFGPIHGDYRLDNLLFGPDGRVFAVDWQTLEIGLPARDLAYLLATCLSVEDRRSAEVELVESYREELARHGVTDYEPAECFDDYRLGMLQCPLIIVLGATYGTRTERGDAMFAAMISRSCQAIRDLGSVELATSS